MMDGCDALLVICDAVKDKDNELNFMNRKGEIDITHHAKKTP